MRKSWCIAWLLAVCLKAEAQVAVSMDKVQVAYELVENPLVVALEHCNCNDIRLSVDMGTVRAAAEPCVFIYTAPRTGKATFSLSRRVGTEYREVGKIVYRVKPLPLPEAHLAGQGSTDITTSVFKKQLGLSAGLDNFVFDVYFKVTAFSIEFSRGQEVIFSGQNTGNVFNDTIKAFRDKVLPGDIIRFSHIRCRRPDGREVDLEPFEIRIK